MTLGYLRYADRDDTILGNNSVEDYIVNKLTPLYVAHLLTIQKNKSQSGQSSRVNEFNIFSGQVLGNPDSCQPECHLQRRFDDCGFVYV